MTSFETELRLELAKMADAVLITSINSFVFAELPEVRIDASESATRTSQHPDQRQSLVTAISDLLYWNCYVQRFSAHSARPFAMLDYAPDREFQDELSAANQSESRWDPDWSVLQTGHDGEIQVRKNDCHRAPVPGEFLFDAGPGMRPRTGDKVSIRIVRESTLVQASYYYCFSEEVPDQFEEFNAVRVYFNLHPEGAAVLLNELTGRLNRLQIPFRFKCPVSPDLFDRRDSGVLYVPWRFWDIARHCVADALPVFESFLDNDVPLFTKPVHSGVALAEDPGGLRSFGQYRCEQVAEGLVNFWIDASEQRSSEVAVDSICQYFLKVGVTLACPWLNPGSRDFLELPSRREPVRSTRHRTLAHSATGIDQTPMQIDVASDIGHGDERFLEAADRIGSRICRDAIWSNGLCNWLEWEAEPFGETWQPVYRALGASPTFPCSGVSLYSGSSGVMLFLARLFGVTGDRCSRDTALASVRQVLEQVRLLTGSMEVGFYNGWTGALWAIVEAGVELEEESLVDAALDELEKVAAVQPVRPSTDIISGSAGLVVGLVDLGLRFGRARLLDVAMQHGKFLLDAAEKSERGVSWRTLDAPVQQNLTGYGHGVSGIICALAELSRLTNESRFSSAVHEGLRYESHYFSEEFGNWEDHRTHAAPEGQASFQFGWCHGAPGIALSRIRLLELGFDTELIQRDLNVALDTTLSKLAYADQDGQREFGLCHGLAGNCEVPLLLSHNPEFLNRQQDGDTVKEMLLKRVDVVARSGIELFGETRNSWPANLVSTGETPTMFNGTSGIGYFYLRAYSPCTIPSVMLLRPDREFS